MCSSDLVHHRDRLGVGVAHRGGGRDVAAAEVFVERELDQPAHVGQEREAAQGRLGHGGSMPAAGDHRHCSMRQPRARAWRHSRTSGLTATGVPTRIATGKPEPVVPAAAADEPVANPPRRPMQAGMRPLVIAIDAGHGGQDPGAHGLNGTREKDVTLAIARELARQINATQGMKAFLTRDTDVFIPLGQRARRASQRRLHCADVWAFHPFPQPCKKSPQFHETPAHDGRRIVIIRRLASRRATRCGTCWRHGLRRNG